MSAPEDSNRKASPPPSLLSEPGQAAGQNGSRILANLEGRVAPQQAGETAAASRSRKGPLALIALAVIAVAGWGAWRINSHNAAAPAVTAAASPASAAAASGATPATLAAASAAAASEASGTQAAQAAGASDAAPQTATIVNDEPASAGSGNRLSQALANGATDASSNATVAAGAAATVAAAAVAGKAGASAAGGKQDVAAAKGKPQHQTKAEARLAAAEAKREEAHARQELAAKKRHDRQLEAAAKRRSAGTTAKKPDDPDADLLAALVARTKPADPGVPLSAKPRKEKAAPVQKVAAADTGSLAARVKECSQRGFFEDQLCRWRVCDGHWGKDPSCPSSANQNRQP
ncbi:phage tail protein [Burkholderia gladioli]|uniref:Phage tail protein n=2 Tax=Burkholderia gladioli TaxID=28095 RepID=A0A2A7S892_BURGA|nr:phage tail protein [Burkholderia gladioli]ATF85640.1 phage tail protein [Burkholderia gladioli pv. gladioli]MBU9197889.1 phage tail protein [Burkholderia gladioli]MBU9424799.1 phage tail protein [Burkholderia gladioli]MCH7271882.1 phage tail protein [Burkholderia gladioli]MDN7804851.1 phage tail protein [Burkholderia gladioli]